ncbi:AAA family ATPase [Caballeronia sp. GAWG1-1]|uniref:AAA family ATPase n=1 Tax=Caballeronia sp. GAWG1-1 TaxID=2921742 RepID=UPI0020294511|nr:AAA family ATPase [Caballeronia sp. GAWG1-1]
MLELRNFERRTLCDDGEFVLSRLWRREDAQTWLAVALPVAHVAQVVESQARLTRAFELRALLDSPVLTRPHALVELRGAATLLLEDRGGVSLASISAGTLGVHESLRIAVNLAAALKVLHARGVMHKDLRPANILVDVASGEVALTGFGRASRATRERPATELAPVTMDALAYLSPEQTGLTNRGVDSRCDLYSLGVVFYEMLAGKLPYRAASPAEWLHCHIARQPIPLVEQAPHVPRQLAAIVARLLAKAAEERYQTALGLEHDLRRCLDSWQRSERIEAFTPGEHDAPEHLLIPERLYGREVESAALANAFQRVAQQGRSEFVLVSGYSGIGKSALVGDLQKRLVAGNGRFASGKFDQYKRDIPYATLAQSFRQLIRQLLDDKAFDLPSWQTRLADALGAHAQLIVDLVPELERVIGPQPAVPALGPREAHVRLQAVLARFIGTFCGPGETLVLFLDDLQWLDSGTSSWIEYMAASADTRHVLFIGAYRDNEVGPTHTLSRVLATVRETSTPLHLILLAPLAPGDVSNLLTDTLHADAAEAEPLASLLFDKTGGNPFFVVQFLRILEEERLLHFDRDTRVWRWDIDRIRAARLAESVVDLMVERIARAPQATQDMLKWFACLGNAATDATLAQVCADAEGDIDAALGNAVEAGLVYRRENGYAFVHDRVQEAAYAMIPPGERALAHLRIARMFDATEAHDAEADIFEIVNQYDRAIALVDNAAERERIVELNLQAGKRAKASSAFGSALTYFSTGSDLLDTARWHDDYARKFTLESNRAECEFLTGDTQAACKRLTELAERANTLPDRAIVTFLRVTLYTALDQMQLAVQTCLEYLRHVGIEWEPHPGRAAARLEYDALLRQIGSKPIERLIDLPLLEASDLAATLDVLTAVLPPAFFSDEDLVCLVLCRMANLSVAHGNSDASSLGYAYLGMVTGPIFGDYQAGFGFGRLGLALVDERALDRFKARVYMCFAYHVTPWTRHIRTNLPLLRRAFDAATESGDLTYTGFSSCTLITSLLAAGEPLADVEREAQERLSIVKSAKFGLIVDIITSQLRLIGHLRGDSVLLAGFDEAEFERRLEADASLAIAACWYWIRKQQWLHFADDIAGAAAAGDKARPLLWTSAGHFEMAEYYFHAALVLARMHDPRKHDVSSTLAEYHGKLQVWAYHGPANFGCRAALVEGEVARIENRPFDAMRHYEDAIALAREHRFVQIEALAHETAARFYIEREFTTIAHVYLGHARRAYLRWGAMAKVHALERLYPELVESPAESLTARNVVAERFDVETVVQASQAISGEIVLERLLRTLMTIVLEHAGARRAVLVLPREEKLWIEAQAVSGRDGVQVRMESAPMTPRELPVSIVHFAMRMRERVHIDDATLPNEFSADEYLRSSGARSVLVVPIIKQAKLKGVLYLENDLAPGVFTAARITVLTLLASQAAISLENASLEQKEAMLEEKEALLHEVHHRVKNNLQLISSLLNLQASRVEDKAVAELFAESRNRVRSMAMVHENLYRAGNFARIMMAPHVRNLCKHLAQAYDMRRLGVDMDVVVDDIQLDMNRAVSCGLIINELVSNALKHAFPGGRGGLLRIELRITDKDRCRLVIADDGVGLSPAFSLDQADTLGLQLVHDLAHQLHGNVDVNRAGGTVFTIAFEAEAS